MASTLASELSDIRQKVREIESARSSAARRPVSAADDPQRTISAQRAMIDKLKRENKQLQEELANDTKDTMASSSQKDRINKLNDLVDTYARKLEIEGRQLESIQQELDVTQAKVHEMRKGATGTDGREGQRQAAKTIIVLENRLQQAEQRFSENITRNRELRTEIESLNKQRETFDQGQIKIEKELQAKRAEITSLQSTAALASEARFAAISQLETLRTQADKEQAMFKTESQELERCLERDQALLKAQTRRLERILGALDDDDEEEGSREDLEEGGPSLSDALQQLARAAGLDPLDSKAIVSHYAGLEAANFAAFNECNSANEKIAAMQKQIRSLQTESRQVEVEGVLSRQKDVIRMTLTKRDAALRRAEILDEKRTAMERRLSAVSSGVDQALKSLGCSSTTPAKSQQAMSGGSAAPSATSAALMGSLGQLEARSRAVVAVWSTVMGKAVSVPGAQAMVNSQLSSSISREAGVAAAAAAAAATVSTEDKPGGILNRQKDGKTSVISSSESTGVSVQRQQGVANRLLDDSGSLDDVGSSEDEAPLTREQMQSMRMAGTLGGQ